MAGSAETVIANGIQVMLSDRGQAMRLLGMRSLPVVPLLFDEAGQPRLTQPVAASVGPSTTGLELARSTLNELGVLDYDLDLYYSGLVVGLPYSTEEPWQVLGRALRVVVSPDGRFSWNADRPNVTYEELARTAQSGMCGRPEDGLTLILIGGYGGLESVDWPFFLQTLEDVRNYLINVGAVYGGVAAIRDLCRGARVTIDAAVSAIRRIAQRGPRPSAQDLAVSIDQARAVRVSVIAQGLDISLAEAGALLELLGYTRAQDNYQPGRNRLSRLNRLLYDSAVKSGAVEEWELNDFLPRLRRDIDRLFELISEENQSVLDGDGGATELLGSPDGWVPPQ